MVLLSNNGSGEKNRQGGLATMEFAIVLLLLIPMMIGIVELGRYIHQYNTLTKAVRDAARFAGDASLTTANQQALVLDPTIITQTQNLVAYGEIGNTGTTLLPGLIPGNVTVTAIDVIGQATYPGSLSPSHVSVIADYAFTPLFNLIPNANITMRASTVQPAI